MNKIMKCKQCGKEIVRIDTMGVKMVCNAPPVHYRRNCNPNTSILTPNGKTVYCVLEGNPEKADGIGYTLHTCFQEEMPID